MSQRFERNLKAIRDALAEVIGDDDHKIAFDLSDPVADALTKVINTTNRGGVSGQLRFLAEHYGIDWLVARLEDNYAEDGIDLSGVELTRNGGDDTIAGMDDFQNRAYQDPMVLVDYIHSQLEAFHSDFLAKHGLRYAKDRAEDLLRFHYGDDYLDPSS